MVEFYQLTEEDKRASLIESPEFGSRVRNAVRASRPSECIPLVCPPQLTPKFNLSRDFGVNMRGSQAKLADDLPDESDFNTNELPTPKNFTDQLKEIEMQFILNHSSSLMGNGLNGRTSSIKLARSSSGYTELSKVDANEKSLLDSLQRFIATEKLAEEVVQQERLNSTMEVAAAPNSGGENPIELIESVSSSVDKLSRPHRHGYNLSIGEIEAPVRDSLEATQESMNMVLAPAPSMTDVELRTPVALDINAANLEIVVEEQKAS